MNEMIQAIYDLGETGIAEDLQSLVDRLCGEIVRLQAAQAEQAAEISRLQAIATEQHAWEEMAEHNGLRLKPETAGEDVRELRAECERLKAESERLLAENAYLVACEYPSNYQKAIEENVKLRVHAEKAEQDAARYKTALEEIAAVLNAHSTAWGYEGLDPLLAMRDAVVRLFDCELVPQADLERKRAFMKLPMEERRRLMAEQAEKVLPEYLTPEAAAEREEWGC